MGSQLPAGGQGGLSPETLRAMQELGITPGAQPMPGGPAVQPPAVPLPNIAPQAPAPAGGGGIMEMLKNFFMGGTSAQELAGPQGVQQAPLTPEELQRRRRLMTGQQ